VSSLILFAIPAFVILLVAEAVLTSMRRVREHDEHLARMRGYEWKDASASVAMGLGNFAISLFTKALALGLYTFVGQYALFEIPYAWWAWALVLVGDDFCYYWFHRIHHEVRLFWAAHENHHSSRYFNLSTALRQSWTTPITGPIFWAPLALIGFPPLMILGAQAVSLIYQYWIHTELIDRMGGFERFFNTPSHHRVHHGRNVQYLDRNYAGILILWDKLFGTFEPEGEPLDYGLTKNIETFNPWQIAFHEWVAMFREAWHESSWTRRLGRILQPPGWSPDSRTLTARQMQQRAGAARF
jgi:sterol desaturase/sphingolipid hydroxylase (fatty acid hydroxylase superfamily)